MQQRECIGWLNKIATALTDDIEETKKDNDVLLMMKFIDIMNLVKQARETLELTLKKIN